MGDVAYPWDTYVAQNGKILGDPRRQVAATKNDLRGANRDTLVGQLRSGSRCFRFVGRNALLMVCGEANIVDGGGGRPGRAPPDVPAAVLQASLVVNPAHTPGGPQAIRDKRCWLSEKGVVVTTANTYSGLPRPHNAAGKAARSWSQGRVMPCYPLSIPAIDGVKVAVISRPR